MAITLKAARVNKGLTQKEAATKIGVAEQTLRNYETGKTEITASVIKRMLVVYECNYNDVDFCPQFTFNGNEGE